jgi:quercetin dioxygenase-like cupin family protein
VSGCRATHHVVVNSALETYHIEESPCRRAFGWPWEKLVMTENIIHIRKWPHQHEPTEEDLRNLMVNEGLEPYEWSNAAGDVYEVHTHKYHKVIYVVRGSITFGFPIEGEPSTLGAGDRLDLPPGVAHNAVVGSEGVTCLEAHVTN